MISHNVCSNQNAVCVFSGILLWMTSSPCRCYEPMKNFETPFMFSYSEMFSVRVVLNLFFICTQKNDLSKSTENLSLL